MSAESDNLQLYRSTVHPLISIAVPFLFLTAFMQVFSQAPFMPRTGPLFFLFLLAVGSAETVLGNILKNERAEGLNRFREFVIILIISYPLLSVFRQVPLSERFNPAAANIVPLLFIAAQWLLTYLIHHNLRDREAYIELTAGREGEELQKTLRDANVFVSETKNKLHVIRRLSWLLFSALTVSVIVFWAAGYYPDTGVVLPVCFFSAVHFLSVSAVNAFIEEFFAAGDGLRIPKRLLRKRTIAALLIFLFILAAALILADDDSFLPLSLIEDFFNRLSSLFQFKEIKIKPPERPRQGQNDIQEMLRALTAEGDKQPSEVWKNLLAVLRVIVIAGLIISAAALIFGPVFSKTFRRYLKHLKPVQFIRRKTLQFLRFLSELIASLKAGRERGRLKRLLSGERKDRGGMQETETDAAARSRAKKREMDRLSKQIVKLLKWGRRRGFRYHGSRTLEEYFNEISGRFPRTEASFDTVRRVFEQARFSPRLLEKEDAKGFFREVKRILSGSLAGEEENAR